MSQDPWQNPNDQHQGGPPPAAYPGYPAYPPYPGGAYGYAMPAPVKPPMPNSVRIAVNLMFTGLGIGLVNMVIGITQVGTINDHLKSLGYSDTIINSDKGFFIAGAVAGGLIGAGLWLWMALATRAGHDYARTVSSVFFGIGVLSSLSSLINSWVPVISKISSVVTLVVGLLAIIFVWRSESGPYFRRAPGPQYGYGVLYPPPPYGQYPPQGQPPYGQYPPQGPPPYGQYPPPQGQPPYGQG